MTNKEYFEKNNISFAEAIKEYNVMKHGSFEHFLYAKRDFKHKYNVGDVIVRNNNGCPFVIYDIHNGNYCEIYHSVSSNGYGTSWEVGGGIDFHKVDNEDEYTKIGHSNLQFAVKLGIIEDEDISREISEYE